MSHVLDLSRWAIVNLNRGSLGDSTILDSSSYSTMWQEYVPYTDNRGMFHSGGGQGLGWSLGHYRDHEIIGHAGSITGFTANLVLVPKSSVAVVMFCNTYNLITFDITGLLLDAALGYPLERRSRGRPGGAAFAEPG